MTIEAVRIGRQGRDKLISLKRFTGIENWNVLCRWAFCTSLAEPSVPPQTVKGDAAVEMHWRTFGGSFADLYLAILKQRCKKDGMPLSDEVLAEQLRLHIQRGLGYLSSGRIRNIGDLLRRIPGGNSGNVTPLAANSRRKPKRSKSVGRTKSN